MPLSNVVFTLTHQGMESLRDGGPGLNDSQRATLVVIDGSCPVAQYRPFLRAIAALDEQFLSLESIGLIERVGTVSSKAVSLFEDSVMAGEPISKIPNIDAGQFLSGFNGLKELD
jgi:hypothetical protein